MDAFLIMRPNVGQPPERATLSPYKTQSRGVHHHGIQAIFRKLLALTLKLRHVLGRNNSDIETVSRL